MDSQMSLPLVSVQHVPFWNDLAPLTWSHHWNNNGIATLTNHGCGVNLRLRDYEHVPSLSGGPFIGTYNFNEVNFHWGLDNENGSLHRIGDIPCAMEFHLTYYNAASSPNFANRITNFNMTWAIVAFCIAEGDHNDDFQGISESVKNIQQPGTSTVVTSNFMSLMKRPRMDIGYLTYVSEIPDEGRITWVVYEEPRTISKEQIDVFRTLMKDNENLMLESKCKFSAKPTQEEIVFVRNIVLPRHDVLPAEPLYRTLPDANVSQISSDSF